MRLGDPTKKTTKKRKSAVERRKSERNSGGGDRWLTPRIDHSRCVTFNYLIGLLLIGSVQPMAGLIAKSNPPPSAIHRRRRRGPTRFISSHSEQYLDRIHFTGIAITKHWKKNPVQPSDSSYKTRSNPGNSMKLGKTRSNLTNSTNLNGTW